MKRHPARATASAILATSTLAIAAAATAGTVAGVATYRERIALPPDAVFEAQLQDVSLQDAPARVLGRATQNPAGAPPFGFVIAYDDAAIDPRGRYAVRATVRHQGRLLFTTDTHVAAFHADHSPVQLRMVAVRQAPAPIAPTAPTSPLRNTYWKLQTLNGRPVSVAERQREPHLVFSATELRVSGHGGCNGLMGGFETEGDRLRFKQMAGTMMACAEGMPQETRFLQALGTVARYRLAGERLALIDGAGTVVAEFSAVALR